MTALNRAVASARVGTEVIRVRGLTFRYPKAAEPAVRGMEFTVGRGEIFGLLGPSGAGKSTTQKLLIGLLRDHGSQATVWDKEPAEWGPDYYERIGVSFELPNHYQSSPGMRTCASSPRCTPARRPTRCSCWPPSAWPMTPTP